MWSCNVNDVNVGVLDQLFVGAVGLCERGTASLFQKLFGSRLGGGRGSGDNGVADVSDIARRGVNCQIFGTARSCQ